MYSKAELVCFRIQTNNICTVYDLCASVSCPRPALLIVWGKGLKTLCSLHRSIIHPQHQPSSSDKTTDTQSTGHTR